MPLISPSLLSADFGNLQRDLEMLNNSECDWYHLDVMDGVFVHNISIGIPVLKSIRKVTDMFLDVHLMITKPVRYVEEFCDAGADLVTVHVEADFPENIQAAIDKIHAKGKKAGVVIKPNTRAEAVLPFLDQCDIVLVMTVEPGFGGQKFIPTTVSRVAAIKAECDRRGVSPRIEVDGGINAKTAAVAAEAGANVFVAGSSVFGADNAAEAIAAIRSAAEGAFGAKK